MINLLPRDASKKQLTIQIVIWSVLFIVNILLVQQNNKLKVLASRPDRALEAKLGSTLPPLEGIDTNGNKQKIAYGQDSRKTALFVFSPRCHACEENMSNWQTIIKTVDPKSFRLAAVSVQPEGVKEYASQHSLNRIPVLSTLDPKYKVTYNLALTPQILLIDAEGKVEKVWTGLLQGNDKQDVGLALNVRLP